MDPLAAIPETARAQRVLELARAVEHPAIFNHSVRTFLYARFGAADHHGLELDVDLLFAACLLHDIGTVAAYDDDQRFEVAGADAAAEFLRGEGVQPGAVDQVWEAIALHTSPGIAERRGPITMLTRLGVVADFGRATPAAVEHRGAIELAFPRLDIERVLGGAVVAQALDKPGKAPRSSWPGGLLAAHLADPTNRGVNPAF
jgi:hypothetical protein